MVFATGVGAPIGGGGLVISGADVAAGAATGALVVNSAVGNLGDNIQRFQGAGSNEHGGNMRETLLNTVQNDKLKNAISEIYRPGATIGDGGLADAVCHEVSTGELVGGKSHIQKAMERITNLENIVDKQPLNQTDLAIATKLLNDLKSALGGV